MSHDDTSPPRDADLPAQARGVRGALVAVATTLLCLFAADWAFRHSDLGFALGGESRYTRKVRLYDRSPGSDVVITGDSRVLHGVDVDTIERVVQQVRGERITAYNAGLSGAPPMAQLAWVQRILDKPKRPRLVVLSISPYMFSSKIDRTLSRESLHSMYRVRDLPAMVRAGAGADDLATVLVSDLFEPVRVRPRLMQILFHNATWAKVRELSEPRWGGLGEVAPAVQADRARGRALGYRTEMWPPATFGNEQIAYFQEALRELTRAHVPVVVMGTPSASQLELAYGPTSIYDQHMRWVKAETARFGVPFFDARGNPAVVDADFVDGDHLASSGAGRFSAWLAHVLIVPQLGGPRRDRPAGCQTVADFERDPTDWHIEGTMVRTAQARRGQTQVIDYRGGWFLSSYGPGADGDTGHAVSPPFVLSAPTVRLRVGGGSDQQLGVSLSVDGQVVAEARGHNDERLHEVVWDVRAHLGRTATLTIRDEARGGWGHLLVDDIAVCPAGP